MKSLALPEDSRQTSRMPGPIWKRPLTRISDGWPVPDEDACLALWDRFSMPGHIREHSRKVAQVAEFLALAAARVALPVDPKATRASALLHDLAKQYTIDHGGNHAQLGGAWVMHLTGNPAIAQGVLHHIHWPWDFDLDCCFLALAVLYADKRVRHECIVPVDERYEDLFSRYGRTPEIIERIESTKTQTLRLEQLMSERLGINLNACTFDSRRLV